MESNPLEVFAAVLEGAVRFARRERPADFTADQWRRWKAAEEVTDGVCSQLFYSTVLVRPRASHALFEGHEDALGLDREEVLR